MSESPKPSSWWQTLPGVLTAIAAVLTALTGLAAILFQAGIIGGRSEKAGAAAPSGDSAQVTASASRAAAARPPGNAPATTGAWSDAVAVVTGRDGTVTRLSAGSLSNCISVDHGMSLDSGQSVPFERMADIEVIRADDHVSPNAKATLAIQLLGGGKVSGTIDANCDLFGYNELGRFSIFYDDLRSIRFER